MAKPIVLAALLAAASAFTAASAFKINVGPSAAYADPLAFTGEAPAAKGPGSDGYWTDLFSPPYTDCPSVMVGISCMNTTNCYVPAGASGMGFGVMSFDGQQNGKFKMMEMPSKPMMLMTVAVGGDKTAPRGAAGGMGFGNGVQYLKHDAGRQSWLPSNISSDELMLPTQCMRASADGRRVLAVIVEGTVPMVLYSSDSGQTFAPKPLGVPLVTRGTGLRYGAIPSDDVWFVTAGNWPSMQLTGEDAVFAARGAATAGGVLASSGFGASDVYALSERLAILRDPATGKLQHKVRDMMKVAKTAGGAPPAPKAGASTDGYAAQIFRTTDGGKTFKSVFEDTGNFYLNGIECTDVKTCYTVANGAEAVYIYGTKDGGDSWRVVFELPRTAESYYSLMSIGVTEGTVIAAGGGQVGDAYESFTLTSDDGETWNRQPGLDGIGDIVSLSLLPGGYGFGTAVTTLQSSTIVALRPKGSPTFPPVATFTQTTCDDAACSAGCSRVSFPQNKCLQASNGASAIVRCSLATSELIEQRFEDGACQGNFTTRASPLNKCVLATSGAYFENSCSQ